MARIYADLIRKGLKTIDDVPLKIKEQVRAVLIDIGCLEADEGESA